MSIFIWNWLTDCWLINVHILCVSYLICIFWTRKMFNIIHQIMLLWGATFDSHEKSLKSEAGTMKIVSRFNAPPNVTSVALSKYDIRYCPRSRFRIISRQHHRESIPWPPFVGYIMLLLCTNILYHTANTGS